MVSKTRAPVLHFASSRLSSSSGHKVCSGNNWCGFGWVATGIWSQEGSDPERKREREGEAGG